MGYFAKGVNSRKHRSKSLRPQDVPAVRATILSPSDVGLERMMRDNIAVTFPGGFIPPVRAGKAGGVA